MWVLAPYQQMFTERVLLKRKNGDDMVNSVYCRMCYRKQDNDEIETEVKKFGCVQCKEPICDSCWPKYDKHKTKVD